MTQRHEVSKCCGENGTNILALHKVATDFNLQKKRKKMKYREIKSLAK